MKTPNITVVNDYDGVFEHRVKAAIELNEKSGTEMVKNIILSSGPYRPYCFKHEGDAETMKLDFYAASRIFGFEHTIEDIADAIALDGLDVEEK